MSKCLVYAQSRNNRCYSTCSIYLCLHYWSLLSLWTPSWGDTERCCGSVCPLLCSCTTHWSYKRDRDLTVVCTFIKHCRRANHCEGITNFILKIRGHDCNRQKRILHCKHNGNQTIQCILITLCTDIVHNHRIKPISFEGQGIVIKLGNNVA